MSTRKRTPTDPTTETPTAVAEPPADEPKPEGPSFADKVGKRKWVPDPDPFPVATDNVAGVRLFLSKRDKQMAIMFGDGSSEGKPSPAIIDTMKEAGWKWNSEDRIWALKFTPESERRIHFEAEKFYQVLRKMIRQEKGIEATPDIPF
jgi:hypothetical protein